MKQKSELDLTQEDIHYSFLYQIGIMMDDKPNEDGHYGREVECTWVGHAYKNFSIEDLERNPRKDFEAFMKRGGPTVINMRFIRNYTKDVEDSWTINAVNFSKIDGAVS